MTGNTEPTATDDETAATTAADEVTAPHTEWAPGYLRVLFSTDDNMSLWFSVTSDPTGKAGRVSWVILLEMQELADNIGSITDDYEPDSQRGLMEVLRNSPVNFDGGSIAYRDNWVLTVNSDVYTLSEEGAKALFHFLERNGLKMLDTLWPSGTWLTIGSQESYDAAHLGNAEPDPSA